MQELIESLLYLSRVSRQELKVQALDLTELADEVVERLRTRDGEDHTVFKRPNTLLAYGDKALLLIVLDNLIGNAWKYSVKVNAPRIELGGIERKGEWVYFVRDNGVGFDMKYADHLFSPFQRMHRDEDYDGLGIGLATVARIVHRHGGEVWAESVLGEGATFYFTLGRRAGQSK
jgi:light-regulated signal transduction histidine kinase (bacteriophytochrome)